jgi:hypothetical protein
MCYERRRAEAFVYVYYCSNLPIINLFARVCVGTGECLYYCSTYYNAVRVGGGWDSGGHVLRETTSQGLCGLVCPSRTSERGGEGYCVKEGGGEEGEREGERAREVRLVTLHPWILRLIRNADALAVTSPTLLFRPM